ncbi:MAG: hypothetical protein ACRDTH_02370 [Pseudonocardiaceae bacterium]
MSRGRLSAQLELPFFLNPGYQLDPAVGARGGRGAGDGAVAGSGSG